MGAGRRQDRGGYATTPTAQAVSPDSGLTWDHEGAFGVAEGVLRVPLPLPGDELRAVNVYVLEGDDGLTLVDGGWALQSARRVLERSLGAAGYSLGDVRGFLVTHVHRDHWTMARVLGDELGVPVTLGRQEEATLEVSRDRAAPPGRRFAALLRSCGAERLAGEWEERTRTALDQSHWRPADVWLDGDTVLHHGGRRLEALATPGHTDGHYVFRDADAALLFAGDHVLPTITPSVGFTNPPPANPLGDFLASLTKVRALPDTRLLPAHGPVADSVHSRVDELLAFHDERLDDVRRACSTSSTALEVAGRLRWTRHLRRFGDLGSHSQGMAVLETRVHLELEVARGSLESSVVDGVTVYSPHAHTPTA